MPTEGTTIEKEDQEYVYSFDGKPKAEEVLQYIEYVKTQNGFPVDKCVYVSIGGADGSEIYHVLKNSAIDYGILIEPSDYGAQEARKKGVLLAKDSKTLVVLQGDAMQRLDHCERELREWSKNYHMEGVILSIQSVLHELPSRSPKFDSNILLAKIFQNFGIRIFFCREPAKPQEGDWPSIVHIRVGGVDGQILHAVSSQIKDKLVFEGSVDHLADNFVQMNCDLAIETLFKILYCHDLERYKYEMNEKLTAFDPHNFRDILSNYIENQTNIDLDYQCTKTFQDKYRKSKVEARTPRNKSLGIPKAFVTITGFQIPKGI
jgi:hypothetical protein